MRKIQNFLVEYLRSIGVKIRYGNGRPFCQVVQYIDNDDRHYLAEIWLDTLAQLIGTEVKKHNKPEGDANV